MWCIEQNNFTAGFNWTWVQQNVLVGRSGLQSLISAIKIR